MEGTIFLNKEAMKTRIQNMATTADSAFAYLKQTKDTMDELKRFFSGESASRLQEKYNEIEATYTSFKSYLDDKATEVDTYTTNIANTDSN